MKMTDEYNETYLFNMNQITTVSQKGKYLEVGKKLFVYNNEKEAKEMFDKITALVGVAEIK